MNKLCEFFGVEYNDLYNVLINTASFIAGGSALRTFLIEADNEPFIDQDLDIFIKLPYNKNDYEEMQEAGDFSNYRCGEIRQIYEEFFKKYQYECVLSH